MAHIGTSGWSYDHWTDVLYPAGLDPRQRLGVYSGAFETVELNASFYRWPPVRTFAGWRDRLPEGFRMSGEGAAGSDAREAAARAGGVGRADHRRLGTRCTPKHAMLLVQLHPHHERDDARLEWFLHLLRRDIPVAVEFRHPSWHTEDVFRLLERHGATYCVMSGAGLPCILRATAQRVYVRLHGPDRQGLYAGSYSDDDLRWWADRIREWEGGGHEVHAYFNNDGDGNAVRNAWRLIELLG